MDNTVEIMIGAIRARICGEEYIIDKSISAEQLNRLYILSKQQDMAHIVAEELSRQGLLGDDEISAKFKKQQMLAVFRYERINYELQEICRVLEAAKISHIPLKGSVIRQYYPEPWMRTSADIDILINEEDSERAIEAIVSELQYQLGKKNIYDYTMTSPSGVHLELHFKAFEKGHAVNANDILGDIWQYAYLKNGYSYHYCISDELFYFYHIAHMAKHFEYGGCGVRFYLDLWLLNHRCEFDREKREALLQKGGLLTFAQVAEKLADIWFSGGEHNEQTLRMQAHVINNGIYGSKENNLAWSQITKGGKNQHAKDLIFLPYENMVKKYPSLKKHKILLPFYHIRRWCSIVFEGRGKASVKLLKTNSDVAKTRKDSVEKLLKDLELIK